MAIKCVTYGGKLGWFLRKHFSKYTSAAYLEYQHIARKRLFTRYRDEFNANTEPECKYMPCLISIETINRCNSTCSFCPANRYEDKRPFQKMSEELFHKLIAELEEEDYSGYLNLYVNNEPFMDVRIEDWYKYAKEHLPRAKMLLYTNGLLLNRERFDKIIPYIDKMIINNYSEDLKLHENLKELYEYVKKDPELNKKDITIQIRYIKEILTNRAGEAPNKKGKKAVHKMCMMPFTDLTVYPDGKVGLCCNDAREKTCLGDVSKTTMKEVWNSQRYKVLREKIGKDRSDFPFCKECDFVDAGIRNDFMKAALKGKL